ncbi:methyltransferase-like protein 25B isoform X1 [Hydractinia symbiolongicarpus]|uniref:methyltransferase-like protein 25B isoform X1 n=1 Tax=Hydractinia symbiolongicarpus TaxID=13093 RepID=UPI00254FFCC3|nr:methyltransferase-like protein 25B isoform X1 [Hydractinia symbiolongicarpus]
MAEQSSENRKQRARSDCTSEFSIYLTEAFMLMKEFKWLSNSYVAEFFTQGLWQKLPHSWRECLKKVTLEEVADNILHDNNNAVFRFVWPLSLLSFIAACHALALNRNQKKFIGKSGDYKQDEDLSMMFKKHIKLKKRHELSVLPQVINTVCKETKTTNVVDVGSGLGHLSRMLAYKYGLNVVAVEMAGQRLPVAEKFDKEIEEELKRLNKKDGVTNGYGDVTHIARWIEPDISTEEFVKLVYGNNGGAQTSLNNFTDTKEDTRAHLENMDGSRHCVLVGLHTCGDLASTMLKVFKNTPMIRGIVSVSCCYFRMSLKEDSNNSTCGCRASFTLSSFYQNIKNVQNRNDEETNSVFSIVNPTISENVLNSHFKNNLSSNYLKNYFNKDGVTQGCNQCNCHFKCGRTEGETDCGFPLSKFLKRLPYQPLQYKSFETACHFVEDYAKKLLNHSPNLKLHCYRAVMEVFIRHVDPSLVLAPVRCKKIKNAASMTFVEYAEKVFERLDKVFDPVLLKDINYEALLSQRKNVTIYHSLVLLLGPVIESIALVDKVMYLLEEGMDATLTPVFDPDISPRNFALVATRET